MATLADFLGQEGELVSRFIAALGEEQEALKVGDIAPLPDINARKGELAAELNALESRRNAWLKSCGHTGDRAGMDNWLAGHPGDGSVARGWEKLLELAARARELNNLNGRLIGLRLAATNQALDALAGNQRQAGLYGRDGQSAPLTGSRVIDAA